jgi:hypothetical protein
MKEPRMVLLTFFYFLILGSKFTQAKVKQDLVKEKKTQLTDLRKLQRRGFPLKTLIHHSFFLSLRDRKPEYLSPQQKRRCLAFTLDSKENDSDFLKVSPER